MSAVLIADGEATRAKRIEEACAGLSIDTRTAAHGAGALEMALAEPPDVVVAPFDLPLIDAAKLADILHTNPRTQAVRFLFLGRPLGPGAEPGPGDETAPAELEPRELAHRIEAMLSRLARLDEVAEADDDAHVSGRLKQIALPDLLQLFGTNAKTGTLELERSDSQGRSERGAIHLDAGNVVQASTGAVEGEKALFRLLAWSEGTFAFSPRKPDVSHEIDKPLRALLMEGMRQIDESNRAGRSLPAADAHVALRVKSTDLPNMVHPLTQEVLLLLEIYSQVQDVVDHCSFPDYQVLRTLHTLMERGMVEMRRGSHALPSRPGQGLFTAAQARRLGDYLDASRPRGAPPCDAKLLLVSARREATADFVRLLRGLPGARLEGAFAGGTFEASDLSTVGRLPVDDTRGLQIVHVPIDPAYAPIWPLAGHGALGVVVLLEGRVAEASAVVGPIVAALRDVPRARIFHAILLRKGERPLPDELRENVALLDEASLFLVPIESGKGASQVLRPLLSRVLP